MDRHLPAIGRFLIVVTFLEDGLRIITQWSDQLVFLRDYRGSEFSRRSSLLGALLWSPAPLFRSATDKYVIHSTLGYHTSVPDRQCYCYALLLFPCYHSTI
jgi:hypothetical protein